MNNSTLIRRAPESLLPIPLETRLRRLLLDNFTGNVQLNIKDGRILGCRVEEIISLASKDT